MFKVTNSKNRYQLQGRNHVSTEKVRQSFVTLQSLLLYRMNLSPATKRLMIVTNISISYYNLIMNANFDLGVAVFLLKQR